MTTYSLFVTCPRGLESVLHAELAAQGCTDLAPTDGGIACTGGLEQVYRANLHSRTAGRVLLRLTKAPYRTEHDIYKPARNIRWQDWFTPAGSIKVHVESKRARIKNPAFVGLKIKDAVCDSQRDSFGERSSVDKQRRATPCSNAATAKIPAKPRCAKIWPPASCCWPDTTAANPSKTPSAAAAPSPSKPRSSP